jgi:uncharacterized membrane protein YgdD (TMEM256/DUF423 family)
MYHVFALLAVAAAIGHFGPGAPNPAPGLGWEIRLLTIAGWSFIAGIFIFSGSLYALALTGTGILGAITPIGGLGFLIGWACLAIFAAGL